MNTYIIGDVQGCFAALQSLLSLINFSDSDTLWFCGDLVNRGPDSLACLRFIESLGDRAVTVLGNHDLSLLAIATGAQKSAPGDTLSPILAAKDKHHLLEWLRHRPIIHYDETQNAVLTHAGIWPLWSLAAAQKAGQHLCDTLRSARWIDFLRQMYGDTPSMDAENLSPMARLRFITNAFTRMRFCDASGALDFKTKTASATSSSLYPWFAHPKRIPISADLFFGHWAALRGHCNIPNIEALDTGCVWGGSLTAIRLADRQRFSIACMNTLGDSTQ